MNTYHLSGDQSIYEAFCLIDEFLCRRENMETQRLQLMDGSYALHGRVRGGAYRKWIGLDKTITVILRRISGRSFRMEFTGLKTADKFAAILPMIPIPTFGLYSQAKLPGRIDGIIRDYIRS